MLAQVHCWDSAKTEHALALHHSAIDRAEREAIEAAVKKGDPRWEVCTGSLDLEVDFQPVEWAVTVAAVAAERDQARAKKLKLPKDRLPERAFSQAEASTSGDKRGTFFDIFKGQPGECFHLATGSDGRDVLEPPDAHGKPPAR